MTITHSKEPRYLVHFTDGNGHGEADVLPTKGGQGAGFGPHELLEASLATCINIWIRMQADQQEIPVGAIAVSVLLKRQHADEVTYEYSVRLSGDLSADQRAILLRAADDCPVRRTLSKRQKFVRRES